MSATPPRDDGLSIIRPAASREPFLATPERDEQPSDGSMLPIGTSLGEFEIKGLIGQGGFSLVYLAYDHSLRREVALKEYMPSAFAARGGGLEVSVISERHAETFKAGLRSFINEAHLLAQFDHPALLKVYRFWEANGTAYMAMPFYQAITLKQTLQHLIVPPDEAWLKNFLTQILDALEVIHAKQCFHRDIAPDNIMMLEGKYPLLLDFGAARRVIGDMTQALTVILKPGYGPIEQYGDVPEMTQGAWTDIYALAAVVHFAITGKVPPPAVVRLMSDNLVPLSTAAAGKYDEKFLRGIDKALAVRPDGRPQTVAEFRALLGLEPETGRPRQRSSRMDEPQPLSPRPVKSASRKRPLAAYAIAAITFAGIIAAGTIIWRDKMGAPSPPVSVAVPVPPVAEPVATPVPAPVTAPIAASVPEPVAPTLPASAPPAPTVASAPEPAVAPVPALPRPVSGPDQMLGDIFNSRDPQQEVAVSVRKAQVVIGKDRLHFSIAASKPGYVYLLMLGSERTGFELLFPNAIDKGNRITPGRALELPRPGSQMVAGEPAGKNQFIAIVSDSPREFSMAGMKSVGDFQSVALDTAVRLNSAYTGAVPLLAGKAVCPAAKPGDCTESFGAAMFSIEGIRGKRKK